MSARETMQPEPEFVAFVGIDWDARFVRVLGRVVTIDGRR
jgi:hypothetical protein